MLCNQSDYIEAKGNLINRIEREGNIKGLSDSVKRLEYLAPESATNDSDIEWIKIVVKTKNFTKHMPIKKAEKLMAAVRGMRPIGSTSFTEKCSKKAIEFLDVCRIKSKKRKHAKIGVSIACVLVAVLLGVGFWYGEKTGLFYGVQALTFTANGQEYTQADAVKYNNYVQLSIPEKKGYDVTGIIDTNTNEKLFDASGKSLSVVSNKDLSDYANCSLEATYEPHVYSAKVMTAKSNVMVAITYTVEDEPEDVLDEPQQLDGYVFDGWFTDSKFKKPFTGDFMDYVDLKEPLVLYPHYSLDGWTLTWDLQGGKFIANVLDEYTILTDVPLPNGDIVKKDGYSLKGWSMNGKLIDYFTPTIMRDATLTAVWEPNEYTITVYSNNGQEPYTQKVLYDDYYALTAPTYKGHTFNNFTAGGKEISAFGIYNYTTNITVFANYTANTYNLAYISDGITIATQEVTYGKSYSLKIPDTKANYEFAGWYDKQVGGSKVTDGVFKTDHDMAVYASWQKVLTINLESDSEYTIDNTIEKAYIIGNYTGTNALMKNVSIKISARDYDLTIELHNAGFKGKSNSTAISCENSSYTLKIINVGTSRIEGGNGANGADGVSGSKMTADNRNGQNGSDGGHALNTGRVIFESTNKSSKLTLQGGSGGNGGNGGVDKDRSRMWLNYTPDGGNGGSSQSALNCIAYSINGTTVTFERGSAGAKGKAGSRGDWWCAACYGSDGKAGTQRAAVTYK